MASGVTSLAMGRLDGMTPSFRSLACFIVTIGLIAACDRETKPVASVGSVAVIPAGAAAIPGPERFHQRGGFGRPWDIAGDAVENQLRAGMLDSMRCLSRKTLKCGPLEIVRDDFHLDSAILRGDSAFTVARYTTLGRLEQEDTTLHFRGVARADETLGVPALDTIVAVHDSTGWRHVRGATAPRVSIRLALLYFELPADDRKRLLEAGDLQADMALRPVLTAPDSIAMFPAELRDTLRRRGCRVPQLAPNDSTNIARGSFYAPKDTDWAVFCAWPDSGRIFVFRNGAGAPEVFGSINVRAPDLDRLPDPFPMDGGPFGCTGAIFTESATGGWLSKGLRAAAGQLRGAERAAPLHDAIGDAACESQSSFFYWTGVRWIQLPGER
jgi:hypothetical protein